MAETPKINLPPETNRKKFSNWLQGVEALNATKTALHDHVLDKWKEELMNWDERVRERIPRFLKCVAKDEVNVINCNYSKTFNKREGANKRKWDCVCEHPTCKIILKNILDLQRNPGFNIIWNSVLCIKLSEGTDVGQLEEDDGTSNIPKVESTSVWSLVYEWIASKSNQLFSKTDRKVRCSDIFKDCKPTHIWCIANMFMQHGKAKTNIDNTEPKDTDPSMFFKMMKNCMLFEIENENVVYLYDNVILCRDKLHHSPTNRLSYRDARTHLNDMIELLEMFFDVPKCTEAVQTINKMLQETVMTGSVNDDNIDKMTKQALEMKKAALETDKKIDKARGFDSKETKALWTDTAKDLVKISGPEAATTSYDGMKSREDYKHELDEKNKNQDTKKVEEVKEPKQKTTTEGEISQFSVSKDEQAKEHVAKMVDILTKCEADPRLYEIMTEQLIPVLDQATIDASEINKDIKEKVNDVNALEMTNQKPAEDKQNSSDETGNLQAQDGECEDSSPETEDNDQSWSIEYLDGSTSVLKSAKRYNVRLDGEPTGESYLTCCRISSTEILLADRTKKKLKKLDREYRIIYSLDLPEWPFDICYVGKNESVVALLGKTLQFVDVRDDMKLTRSHVINHDCTGLAYHDNQLYVIDNKSVNIYSTDGIMRNVLYTHELNKTAFRHIALNDNMIYIACLINGLVTIDVSGNYINTFSEQCIGHVLSVCVDGEGNALVCGNKTANILQICSNGNEKVAMIENKSGGEENMTALYYDRENDAHIALGHSGFLTVLKLK